MTPNPLRPANTAAAELLTRILLAAARLADLLHEISRNAVAHQDLNRWIPPEVWVLAGGIRGSVETLQHAEPSPMQGGAR